MNRNSARIAKQKSMAHPDQVQLDKDEAELAEIQIKKVQATYVTKELHSMIEELKATKTPDARK